MTDILLHTCCAPCSAAVLEWLLRNDYEPTLFYYNPNIFPREEYEKRKQELTRYAEKLQLRVIDGDYEQEKWLLYVEGLENEQERGARCEKCFEMRLIKTAQIALEQSIDLFATTLASSRWKDLAQIAWAGLVAEASVSENVKFFNKNWRKDGLQQRRRELIKENNFYNQNYCGCKFSIRIFD
ncbi:MAG: epoxyqueuosine reductase QueH [Bacteroidales bacterium]|jgi:predicted adenine nucleotide alpha hydrolase (AANH) superfamily ATPase|nr:epoxyqueuosine reductase QueH [Bacteroidales bacterium]